MNNSIDVAAASLKAAILAELRARPQGISEYELLRALERRCPSQDLGTAELSTSVGLYRTHFLLFHFLYRLRRELRQEGKELEIHCLRIVLRPLEKTAEPGAMAVHDPLEDFYLDLANLDGVDAEQVDDLLQAFWRRFAAFDRRSEALAVLGLEDPVDAAQIKQQYRRLAMRHHPDRGGDRETLQRINAAMATLQALEA